VNNEKDANECLDLVTLKNIKKATSPSLLGLQLRKETPPSKWSLFWSHLIGWKAKNAS